MGLIIAPEVLFEASAVSSLSTLDNMVCLSFNVCIYWLSIKFEFEEKSFLFWKLGLDEFGGCELSLSFSGAISNGFFSC